MAHITVRLHGAFSELAGGARRATVEATTVRGALDALALVHPEMRERLRDEHGKLREHLLVFANQDRIDELQGEETPLADGDTVHLIPAVSGGS